MSKSANAARRVVVLPDPREGSAFRAAVEQEIQATHVIGAGKADLSGGNEFAGDQYGKFFDSGAAGVHPKAHGALADGSDDAVAVQATIDAAIALGVPIDGGRLTYTVAAPINAKGAKIRNLKLKAHAGFVGSRLFYSDESDLDIDVLHLDGSSLGLSAAEIGASGTGLTGLRIGRLVAENFLTSGSNSRCITVAQHTGGVIETLITRNCTHRNNFRFSTGCVGVVVKNRISIDDQNRVCASGGDGVTNPTGCAVENIFISGLTAGSDASGEALFIGSSFDVHYRGIQFVNCTSMGMNMVKIAENAERCSATNIYGRALGQSGQDGFLGISGAKQSWIADFDVEDTQTTAGTASLLYLRQHPLTAEAPSGSGFRNGRIRGAKPCQVGSESTSASTDSMDDAFFENVEVISSGAGMTLYGLMDNLRLLGCRIHSATGRALNVNQTDTSAGDITNLKVHNSVFHSDAATECVRLLTVDSVEFTHNRVKANNAAGNALVIDSVAVNGVAHNNSTSGGANLFSVNVDDQGNVVEP